MRRIQISCTRITISADGHCSILSIKQNHTKKCHLLSDDHAWSIKERDLWMQRWSMHKNLILVCLSRTIILADGFDK